MSSLILCQNIVKSANIFWFIATLLSVCLKGLSFVGKIDDSIVKMLNAFEVYGSQNATMNW